MRQIPDSLAGLSSYKQFMRYRVDNGVKKPIDATTGKIADSTNPQHHCDADTALSSQHGDGVAFILTPDDPFFFLDIDKCHDENGWSELSTSLVSRFPGCAVEVSHSGHGLHIIGSFSGPEPEHRCKRGELGIELYTSYRFIALTGTGVIGDVNHDATGALHALITEYFQLQAGDAELQDWTNTHQPDSTPIQSDEKLLEKALESRGAFGKSATFRQLWECDVDELSRHFPDNYGDRSYDASSADAALAQHLAFWTGGNCERIERLMRESALCRDKYDWHKSYLATTIRGAVARSSRWYDLQRDTQLVKPDEIVETGDIIQRHGFQLIAIDKQQEMFAGCVYVADRHGVFTPEGVILTPERFNAMYGGYVYQMDEDNERTSKKAFEVFTESTCLTFPRVQTTTFRPDLETGKIVKERGQRAVNTFVPADVDVIHGADVSPFLDVMNKLFPDERDRTIITSYMAACIQYPGVKFQWCPFIQGTHGNGKTLLSRVVKHGVGREYSHFPKASQLHAQHNGWMVNKLFVGVEEVKLSEHRTEVIEILKIMVTGGDDLEIRAMHTEGVTRSVTFNMILNSNYKDALGSAINDRRYCPFFTPQQSDVDLIRDGMGGDYFPDLYDWLRDGGYAAVTGYLIDYEIPAEFNPAGKCHRAPETTSSIEASTSGLGPVEQEIVEAIEQGRPGFIGGWVSSFALDRLIDEMRRSSSVPRSRRRELMKSLGYDYHPGLRDGRVNNPTMLDGGKPRLYIKPDHISAQLTTPSEIQRAYETAQGLTRPSGSDNFKTR